MPSSVVAVALLSACVLVMDASGCHLCPKPIFFKDEPACLNPKAEYFKKHPLLLKMKCNLFEKLNKELKDVVCLDCQKGICTKCTKTPICVAPVPPHKQYVNNVILNKVGKTASCTLPCPAPVVAPCAVPPPAPHDCTVPPPAPYDCDVPPPAHYAPCAMSSPTYMKQVPNSSEEEFEAAEPSGNLWAQLLQGGFIPQV